MKNMLSSFLSCLAAAVCALSLPVSCLAQASGNQLFELRVYKLKSEEKAALFDRTVQDAYLPALKRAGVGPVGIFKPKNSADNADAVLRYMVLPFNSAEEVLEVRQKVAADSVFADAAADYLSAGKGSEILDRIESSLLIGFDGMPKLKLPAAAKEPSKRFFELRIYESLSEMKGMLKVQMFNEGELAIFDKVGLKGVFYGQALVGDNLPQLTYMLVYEDEADHKAAWKRFLEHPDWIKLKGDETYKDTVSKIENVFLVALDYSQVK